MSRHLILGLWLVVPLSLADTLPAPENAQDLSYALGASLGERLRQEVPGLQLETLVEGLRAAYDGKPLKLDGARMQAILQAHEEQSAQTDMDKALLAEKRFMANERARAGVHELTDGILYSEIIAGTGAQATPGGRVKVRYVGKLPDGSVFDRNEQAQWFRLDSVIDGWQVAVPRMKTGAKWRLVIPSDQAYGAEGAGDLIAPYTPLVFELELLEVAD